MAEMGSVFGLSRNLANEVGGGAGGGMSFGGVVPVLGAATPMMRNIAGTEARNAMQRVMMQRQMQDEQARRALMQQQMQQAQDISDAVPRGPQQPQLPELPPTYRPPQYWNYGQPVRMG